MRRLHPLPSKISSPLQRLDFSREPHARGPLEPPPHNLSRFFPVQISAAHHHHGSVFAGRSILGTRASFFLNKSSDPPRCPSARTLFCQDVPFRFHRALRLEHAIEDIEPYEERASTFNLPPPQAAWKGAEFSDPNIAIGPPPVLPTSYIECWLIENTSSRSAPREANAFPPASILLSRRTAIARQGWLLLRRSTAASRRPQTISPSEQPASRSRLSQSDPFLY